MVAERQPESKPNKTKKTCKQCGTEVTEDQARASFEKYDQVMCQSCIDAEEAPVPGSEPDKPQEPNGPKDAGGSLTYDEALKEMKYHGKNEEGQHIYLMREEYGVPEGMTWMGATTPEVGGVTYNKLMLPFGAPKPGSREYDEEICAAAEASDPSKPKPQEPETQPDPSEDPDRIAEYGWKAKEERKRQELAAAEQEAQPGDIREEPEKQEPVEQPKKSEPLEVPAEPTHTQQISVPQAMAMANGANSKQIQELTALDIKKYLNPTLTEAEAYLALQLCKARGLNPFTGDVHIIKYESKNGPAKPVTLVTSKYVFMSRAETAPDYGGFEAGIVVTNNKPDAAGNITLQYRAGSLTLPGETIVGGWAKVYRTTRAVPTRAEVSMEEYKRDTKIWKEKPATMIRKVALVQALREACPDQLAGLYESSEIEDVDIERMKQVDNNPRLANA